MTPQNSEYETDRRVQHQETERPPDSEQDRGQERPIGDGATGDALTVGEAKNAALERVRNQGLDEMAGHPPIQYPDGSDSVVDGATGEPLSVKTAKRRAAARWAGSRMSDTGVLPSDAGKPIVTADGTILSRVKTAEGGAAKAVVDPEEVDRDQLPHGAHVWNWILDVVPHAIAEITEDGIRLKEPEDES